MCCSDSEGGCDSEQRSENGEDIDQIADSAMDSISDQRVECGSDFQREAVAIAEIGETDGDDGVNSQCVQAPVEKCDLHRVSGGIDSFTAADRQTHVMHDRFCDAKEHEADCHAG